MITINRSVFIAIITASLFIGSLATGLLSAAKNPTVKYDYTLLKSGFDSPVKGEDGNIEYSDKMKKLLDDGWKVSILTGNYYLMVRER